MNGKTKFLILGLILGVVLGLFLSHFWSFTICALEKAVATGIAPLVVSKFAAVIPSMRFLL